MKRLSVLIAASLLALPAFAAESVATLSAQEGTVLVNQGEEFITASEKHALMAGDRVMLMEGASAELSFTDGCALPLVAGSMVEIPAVSPCAGGVAKTAKVGPTYAQAPGSRANDDDDNTAAYIVFGGGLAYIIYEVLDDSYSITPPPPPPPASP